MHWHVLHWQRPRRLHTFPLGFTQPSVDFTHWQALPSNPALHLHTPQSQRPLSGRKTEILEAIRLLWDKSCMQLSGGSTWSYKPVTEEFRGQHHSCESYGFLHQPDLRLPGFSSSPVSTLTGPPSQGASPSCNQKAYPASADLLSRAQQGPAGP